MPMKVTLNIPKFQPLVNDALLKDIGDLAVRMIRTRTQQGTDREGKPFQPYTPGYAEKKSAELGTSTVDLTVSGRMLNDMGVTDVNAGGKPPSVSIGFRSSGGSTRGKGLTMIQRSRAVGAEDKARAHNETGAGRSRVLRQFLGLTGAETNTLRDRIARHLDGVWRANLR